jgi:hypothetical protein
MSKKGPKIARPIQEDIKKTDTLESILEPYEHQEFLPSHVIPQIIQLSFPSSTIIHTYSPHHHVIKLPIRELLQASISNWQFNRPADRMRCEDIGRYIAISKKPVDTMLYVSFNNKKRTFDVIDGIHRYTALAIIKETSAHLDFISGNECSGDMTWLWDSFMILNVRMNATEGELIELFKSLNKSNPIPELYVRDVVKDKREYIQSVAVKWQNRFKPHFSASNKPNRPHINRDRFIDVLDAVYDKYHLTEETKEKLEQTLERNNGHISQNIPKKLPTTIREKCEASGCWLFLYSVEDLIKML